MKIIIKNQPTGFTLVELLIYIAVAAVILLALSQFFALALSIRVKAQSVAEVEQQGTLVLTKMTQIIRNATAITTPITGATSTSLTLTVSTGTNSPTIFDVASSILRIKEGTANAISLTDSHVAVTNLIFSNLTDGSANGSIQIQFTLSKLNSSTTTNEYNYTQNFRGSATLR